MDTTSIVIFGILAITVYYILTDGSKSNCNKENKKEVEEKEVDLTLVDNGTVEDIPEEFRDKPPVQEVGRRHNITDTSSKGSELSQTTDYNPTSTGALPKIQKVIKTTTTTTTTTTEEIPTNNTQEQNISSELTMEDLTGEAESREVQCPWCDFTVTLKKGESIPCPRCSGTID